LEINKNKAGFTEDILTEGDIMKIRIITTKNVEEKNTSENTFNPVEFFKGNPTVDAVQCFFRGDFEEVGGWSPIFFRNQFKL
jgi:hypothetical protein